MGLSAHVNIVFMDILGMYVHMDKNLICKTKNIKNSYNNYKVTMRQGKNLSEQHLHVISDRVGQDDHTALSCLETKILDGFNGTVHGRTTAAPW